MPLYEQKCEARTEVEADIQETEDERSALTTRDSASEKQLDPTFPGSFRAVYPKDPGDLAAALKRHHESVEKRCTV